MQTPHLAWHLSGGTTELLLVTPDGKTVRAEKLGGTSDISAGQLIDRTGKLLGLPFPAGKAVDALSRESDCKERYRVKLNGLEFSFSGIQNKAETFYSDTQSAADTARFVMNCIVSLHRGCDADGACAVSGSAGRVFRRRRVQLHAAGAYAGVCACFCRAAVFHGQRHGRSLF